MQGLSVRPPYRPILEALEGLYRRRHGGQNGLEQYLAGVLQEKITSFAEQIFLITHDSALSAGLPNTCFLERDKGKGEPTQVRGT